MASAPVGLPCGLILQALVYVVVIGGFMIWLFGKSAPVGLLLVDAAFGAVNLWWLLQSDTRRAFGR